MRLARNFFMLFILLNAFSSCTGEALDVNDNSNTTVQDTYSEDTGDDDTPIDKDKDGNG